MRIIRDKIEEEITKAEQAYNFQQGYKLLYVPWKTIETASIAFISLNPGKPPEEADLRVLSDERGNSYEVEKYVTESPLTDQFLKLAEFLKVKPIDILTGAMCPFRSGKWEDFTKEQKIVGFEIGKSFWLEVLKKDINLLITLGNQVTNELLPHLDAKLELLIDSGWGNVQLKRYTTKDFDIVQLPHLSSFKIFSREECSEPIKRIFDNFLEKKVVTPQEDLENALIEKSPTYVKGLEDKKKHKELNERLEKFIDDSKIRLEIFNLITFFKGKLGIEERYYNMSKLEIDYELRVRKQVNGESWEFNSEEGEYVCQFSISEHRDRWILDEWKARDILLTISLSTPLYLIDKSKDKKKGLKNRLKTMDEEIMALESQKRVLGVFELKKRNNFSKRITALKNEQEPKKAELNDELKNLKSDTKALEKLNPLEELFFIKVTYKDGRETFFIEEFKETEDALKKFKDTCLELITYRYERTKKNKSK